LNFETLDHLVIQKFIRNSKLKIQNWVTMDKKIDNNKPFLLRGDSETGVLLLHGWTSPAGELRPMADFLNSLGYSVYVPLLRGHGTCPEDLLGVKWQDWFEDAEKALEELKKCSSSIFVSGISMGGNLAMMLAEDESVAGIMPMGASVKYKFHSVDKLVLVFMALTKVYRKKYYPPWVRKKMGKRDVYPHYPVESAREIMRLADATRKFLPEITKPILIMQSDADHMVSKKSPQIIFDGVKSKTKEIFWVKGAYHVFAQERKVWEKIGEFVSRV